MGSFRLTLLACAAALLLSTSGCKKEAPAPATEPGTEKAAEKAGAEKPGIKAGRGVDLATKTLKVGTLNDESGPAAILGKPYAVGKRLLAKRINAGGSGLLPEGWKMELVERDHGYNPQKSVQSYNEIKGEVLYIATSMGTPNTLPLQPHLKRDGMVAYPASLSSKMAGHEHTPPLGPSYSAEASRAMDWIVEAAGGAANVKAGIVYQQDDYGKDGLDGWKKAAAHHKVNLVSEQSVAPGQKDMAAVVTALKNAGATHVLLTTLPSATGPILGTAAQLQFAPMWIGQTPSWIDRFFDPKVIPSAVLKHFYWAQGLPFWGENVEGMKELIAAYEAHVKDDSPTDFYLLISYVQGLTQVEAARLAIEAGDITPAGYLKAVRSMKGWDAGGLIQPIDLTTFPYVTSTHTRVLKPSFQRKTWDEVAPYAEPKAGGS